MTEQPVEISPEVLHEAGHVFLATKEANKKQIKELEAAVKKVLIAWPNAEKQGFFQTYKLLEGHMQGLLALMEEIAKDMKSIAERFEETDKF
ncbi:MAG: WXG100 family type VII secretion target [Anaerolineales bacterium]|nr:WXG100 family type VII secretion target [Anaerolineales bacterium]